MKFRKKPATQGRVHHHGHKCESCGSDELFTICIKCYRAKVRAEERAKFEAKFGRERKSDE